MRRSLLQAQIYWRRIYTNTLLLFLQQLSEEEQTRMPLYIDETVPAGEDKTGNFEIDADDDILAINESAIARMFFVGSLSAG